MGTLTLYIFLIVSANKPTLLVYGCFFFACLGRRRDFLPVDVVAPDRTSFLCFLGVVSSPFSCKPFSFGIKSEMDVNIDCKAVYI